MPPEAFSTLEGGCQASVTSLTATLAATLAARTSLFKLPAGLDFDLKLERFGGETRLVTGIEAAIWAAFPRYGVFRGVGLALRAGFGVSSN